VAEAAKKKTPDWAMTIREHNPGFIVWDSLRKLHDLSENDSEVPRRVIGSCKKLIGYERTMLYNHHTNKGWDPDMPDSAKIRGNRAWTDDGQLGLFIDYNDRTEHRVLKWTKHNACKKPMPMTLEIPDTELIIRSKDEYRRVTLEWLKLGMSMEDAAVKLTEKPYSLTAEKSNIIVTESHFALFNPLTEAEE